MIREPETVKIKVHENLPYDKVGVPAFREHHAWRSGWKRFGKTLLFAVPGSLLGLVGVGAQGTTLIAGTAVSALCTAIGAGIQKGAKERKKVKSNGQKGGVKPMGASDYNKADSVALGEAFGNLVNAVRDGVGTDDLDELIATLTAGAQAANEAQDVPAAFGAHVISGVSDKVGDKFLADAIAAEAG